jgi:hypothetical protein
MVAFAQNSFSSSPLRRSAGIFFHRFSSPFFPSGNGNLHGDDQPRRYISEYIFENEVVPAKPLTGT